MDVSDGLDVFRLAVFQTVDAVVQRRMGAEPRIFGFAGNAHCGHSLRQVAGAAF